MIKSMGRKKKNHVHRKTKKMLKKGEKRAPTNNLCKCVLNVVVGSK